MKEFGDSIIPDNIAYYVDGSEDVAKVLKLKVNVNDASITYQACEKLETMAEALSRPLSDKTKSVITSWLNRYFYRKHLQG